MVPKRRPTKKNKHRSYDAVLFVLLCVAVAGPLELALLGAHAEMEGTMPAVACVCGYWNTAAPSCSDVVLVTVSAVICTLASSKSSSISSNTCQPYQGQRALRKNNIAHGNLCLVSFHDPGSAKDFHVDH